MTLLLYMVADGNRRGYRHMLDAFWDEARSHGLQLPTEDPISAPSFCNARCKITSDLLRRMLHTLADDFENAFGSARHWRGRRVFAVDGTKVNLQRGDDLEEKFGVPEGGHCPQALVSVLIDVCAKAPVDLVVSPYGTSERDDLLRMLPSLSPRDVLVLDRGYPSHEVLQALVTDRIDFLIRVPSSHTFAAIDKLRASSSDDRVFLVEPPIDAPDSWKPIELRAIRLRAPDGDESYFLTTLRASQFTRRQLRELYHLRWEAEEFFKLMKGDYIGQGQFRSRMPAGVEQEIHALVLFLAIARVLMASAEKATGVDYKELSQKAAILGLAAYVTRIFLEDDATAAAMHVDSLIGRIVRTREKRRPDRSAPRVSFKPRLRWGPTGRIGG